MRVAVLGTGIMGAPMARNLLRAGHEVVVWNRTAEKARALEPDGATVADDPVGALHGVDAVMTMLTDGAAVEAVADATGPGLAGKLWWQASTVGMEATQALAELAAQRGATFVDAPVLGTKAPAEQGSLVVLASGADEALDRAQPLFDACGSRTMRLGGAGTGTRLKLVANHWVALVVNGLAETLALAEGLGLDGHTFLEAIDGGPLDLGYAHLKGPGMLDRDLPVAFPLRHALKDVDLLLRAAHLHDVDLGLAPAMRERFSRAVDQGLGDADLAAVFEVSRPSSR